MEEEQLAFMAAPLLFCVELGYAFMIYYMVMDMKPAPVLLDIILCGCLCYFIPTGVYYVKNIDSDYKIVWLPYQSIAYAIVYYCSVRWKSMRGEKAG